MVVLSDDKMIAPVNIQNMADEAQLASLNERQRKILKEVCNSFISTGEPVGSRTLSRFSNLACSPATIRNGMADLELMGYLFSPHASAGRIPTEKGFRFYVSFLVKYERVSKREEALMNLLASRFEEAHENRGDILRSALRLASDQTKLGGMALAPQSPPGRLRSLKVFRVLEDKAMLIMIDDSGQITDQLIQIPSETSDSVLEQLENFLNTELCNQNVIEHEAILLRKSHELVARHSRLLSSIVRRIHDALVDPLQDTIFLEGFMNFFDQPEFKDPLKIRDMISLLDQKEELLNLLARNLEKNEKIVVNIGSQSGLQIQDLSVVTARYQGPNKSAGRIGVIGPLRMDYAKVVVTLAEVSNALSRLFTGSSTSKTHEETSDE